MEAAWSSGTRPLIGITCSSNGAQRASASEPLVDRLGHTYARAVATAGGVPVLVPNVTESPEQSALLARLNGLLLSGGYDVAPARYGEAVLNDTVEVDGPRDEAEMPLICAAVRVGLPILAICRGIQALNVALGGTLWQDLPAQRPSSVAHRQAAARDAATHAVRVSAGSRLSAVLASERVSVNSFHHQAVKEAAPGLCVVARAEDGVIEALEADRENGPFLLAVQWHPEEMTAVSEEARSLFSAFVGASRRR